MSNREPGTPRPPRDLRAHHRQTDLRLLVGFLLILLMVGSGLIAWNYGWRGLAGGLFGILAGSCLLLLLGGLVWLLLTWAGRWADRE